MRRATLRDAADLAQLKVEWTRLDQSPSGPAMGEFEDLLANWVSRQGDYLVVEVAVAVERVVGMAWVVLFERVPDFFHRQRLTADIQSVYEDLPLMKSNRPHRSPDGPRSSRFQGHGAATGAAPP